MINQLTSMLVTTKTGNFVVDISPDICAQRLRLRANREFHIQPYENLFRSQLVKLDSKNPSEYQFYLEGQIDYSYPFQSQQSFVTFATLKGTLQIYDIQKTRIRYESTIVSNRFHNRKWSASVILSFCFVLIILLFLYSSAILILPIILLGVALISLFKQVSNPRDELIEIVKNTLDVLDD